MASPSIATFAVAVTFAIAPLATAQIAPVPGTGCSGVVPAPAQPGPSAIGDTVIFIHPPFPLCTSSQVFFIGICAAPPQIVPKPISCGIVPCTLDCAPFAVLPGPLLQLTIPATAPVGAQLCVQGVCVLTLPVGPPCANLSEKVTMTIQP